jgi:hypothetical protein
VNSMSPDESTTTPTSPMNGGKERPSSNKQPGKKVPGNVFNPIKLEDIVADWKKIGEKARDLNKKMNQNVLNNIEKIETLHYQNMKNADAIKQKIEQDWHAFELEVQNGMETIKTLNQQHATQAIQDLNTRKEELNENMKLWEKNYQEWSAKTGKKVKETMTSFNRIGWKLYVSFLIVAIPIVIIIVVLANALK